MSFICFCSFKPFSLSLSINAISQLFFANNNAISFPIPFDAPVIIQILLDIKKLLIYLLFVFIIHNNNQY